MTDYLLHLIIFVLIYWILAQSLNICSGFAGLISLAHAGFYGIGAYTTAILSTRIHTSFWLNLPIAMALSAAVAFFVATVMLRTVEDYFVIGTLAIQVIVFSVLNSWTSLTNGPIGISGIPKLSLFGINLQSKVMILPLAGLIALMVYYLIQNLSSSGFGKSLRAISEDEIFTQSLGKDVNKYKLISFTLAATFAAIAGAIYAHYVSYIDPSSFSVGESIFILSIVIVGGLGNLKGSFWAAAFFICLPEALRFLGMSDNIAANVRQIIYGILLILITIRQPGITSARLKRISV